MIWLYLLYTFILFLYSIFILCKYLKLKIKTTNNKQIFTKHLDNDIGLFIVIPCLREQKCIKETIDYFRNITDLPIVIITTQKENFEYNYNKNIITTKEIIEKEIINNYNDVYLVDYPYTNGYMADQLNYMLTNLSKLDFYSSNKNWYMSLYNADSKPSKQTFQEVVKSVNQNNKIIQQYSYCFKNYDKLNFILKGFAIYQSNFEIKVGLMNSYLDYKYLYKYVVGHGLTIEINTLNKLGNFNTKFWCEDIYLTMKIKFKNLKIKTITQLENIENADTLKKVIMQNSVWYNTTKKYQKIYKDIHKCENKFSLNGLIGCINEFRCAINWLMFPIIFILILFFSIIQHQFLCTLLLVFTYFIYIYCNLFLTFRTINYLENKKYKINFCNYFSLFIVTLISNSGPIYSFLSNKKEKYKTER